MSEIVSISLPKKTLSEMEALQRAMGYSGRSETIRAAISLLAEKHRAQCAYTGDVCAALLAVHEKSASLEPLLQKHAPLIQSRAHHPQEGAALCILVLNGPAKKVCALADALGALRGVRETKLLVY